MLKNSLNRRVLSIRVWEGLLIIGVFLFFALAYHLTLWINRGGMTNEEDRLLDFVGFLQTGGLNYTIKLIFTIPIWWIIFRFFKDKNLLFRLSLHIFFLPVYVLSFKYTYYAICDYLGWGHLTGVGEVWDIFIPSLLYFILFGFFHAYEYYLSNQRNLKLKAELTEAALKSELAALKAQLNPHFLYNVFNTISASVDPGQEHTRELIASLSDLFRYQLKASKSELVPLREELEFNKKYLELEKARFEERLKVNWNISEDVMDNMVPPMLLQPIIENAVKHGLASLIEGGEINITILKKNKGLHFEISDTGVGVEDKELLFNNGIGLTNTKLRLEKQYGSELIISDNDPHGLKIAFDLI